MSVQFEVRVITNNGAAEVKEIRTELAETGRQATETGGLLKKMGDAAFTFNNISAAITTAGAEINRLVEPGIAFNSSLKDMQAITGVSDTMLEKLGQQARNTAKTFGLDAAAGVESYKLLLSKLGPELANTPDALAKMGEQNAILSKQLGGDLTAAANVATTAMNQYGVSMEDPAKAAGVMAEMNNIMSAAAKQGSAELPAIAAALEQSGMMAKTANVSFAELNAGIQILDKSGKKGAEGGVALRNVMATLSEGSFMSRQSLAMLQAAGVDVNTLGDKSKSLSERMAALRPIVGDTAAMTQLFGKENVAAGIALAQNTGELANLTQQITGTNTAQEMANTKMSSFSEKMARANAQMKDWGISLFNATEGFLPFVQIGMGAVQTISNLGGAVHAFGLLANTSMVKSIMSSVTAFGSWIASTITATAAQWGLNIALNANPLGLVVLAVAAAVGAIALLITYWDEIKAAIGAFAEWVWNHHPFKFLIDLVDKIFPGFKAKMGELWDWVKKQFEVLLGWLDKAWQWIKKLFGGGDASLTVTEKSVTEYGQAAGTEGVSAAAVAASGGGITLGGGKGSSGSTKNSATSETASRINSGGSRPTQIQVIIHKIQDYTMVKTETLEMGAKEAADKILEMIVTNLNSLDGGALTGA